MKNLVLAISIVLVCSTVDVFADETVAVFKSQTGDDAIVKVSSSPTSTSSIITWSNLRIEIGSQSFRIANSSAEILLQILCEPYSATHPFTYNTVEPIYTGFLGFGAEPIAEISPDGSVIESREDIAITDGYCQKEMH